MESLRDRILSAKDKLTVPYFVEEWNETVYIKSWNGGERSNFMALSQEATKKPEKYGEWVVKTLVWSLVNEQGENIFTNKDVNLLLEKNGAVMERILAACMKHNVGESKN